MVHTRPTSRYWISRSIVGEIYEPDECFDADAFDAWSPASAPIPMICLDRRSSIINRLITQPRRNHRLAAEFRGLARSFRERIRDTHAFSDLKDRG